MKKLKYDEIGYWSEVKLDIIREYASTYTKIMAAQQNPSFTYIYIDAFAGAGQHKSKKTGEFIDGSPLNALNIQNPFKEYYFIDLNNLKVNELENIAGKNNNVFIYHGDCNIILPTKILPHIEYSHYKRALCILDPYGLHLDWNIIETAGKMKTIEIFLNFPIMDINMNVLKHDQSKTDQIQINRMNSFWGDESWRQVAFTQSRQQSFLDPGAKDKTTNKDLAKGFRERLKKVAGFEFVPEPMPMRNSNNAIVYYLYFASHKPVAKNIVEHIFRKHSDRKV
jgi:three-Cys-motif partner protein